MVVISGLFHCAQFYTYQQIGSACLFCVSGVLNGRQRLDRLREDTFYSVRLGVDVPLGDRNAAMSSNTSKGNEADFAPGSGQTSGFCTLLDLDLRTCALRSRQRSESIFIIVTSPQSLSGAVIVPPGQS
jgi:hypothetical protein